MFRGVARRLAEWHAVLPINDNTTNPISPDLMNGGETPLDTVDETAKPSVKVIDDITPIVTEEQGGPTLWTVTQKWILALPVATAEERERRKSLQKEFERIVAEFDDKSGLGENGVSRSCIMCVESAS